MILKVCNQNLTSCPAGTICQISWWRIWHGAEVLILQLVHERVQRCLTDSEALLTNPQSDESSGLGT